LMSNYNIEGEGVGGVGVEELVFGWIGQKE
jgi:hypothetical protein